MADPDKRLDELRQLRQEAIALLKEKINAVKAEKHEMIAAYDEQIGEYETELAQWGCPASGDADRPTDAGVRAYNYLKENAGQFFSGGRIMKAIRCEGAVASIALAPFILSGKVMRQGQYRNTVYGVARDDASPS